MKATIRQAGPISILLALSACGPGGCSKQQTQEQEQRDRVYATVAECQADIDDAGARRYSDEDCTKALADAQQAHKDAPKFSQQTSCEERYGVGRCESHHEGDHDVFLPLMAGFLLGHAPSGSTPVTQPIYVDRTGNAYAGSNHLGSYRSCGNNDRSCSGGSSGYVYSSGVPGGGAGTGPRSTGNYSTQTISPPRPSPSTERGGFGGSKASVTMPTPSSGAATTPSGSVSSGVVRGGFGSTATSASASSGE
jgi:uncharacterized protein YgiB involved in biofilm formation